MVDVLGCASDDPPSAEVDESLIRSGVPESEGSGIVSSVMNEIREGLHALKKFSEAVVSLSSWSREFLSPACTLSPEPTVHLSWSFVG